MTRNTICLAPALAFLCFGACTCEEEIYSLPGSVGGVVCSADTGAPLPGITVTVTDQSGRAVEAVTDEAGAFLAERLTEGEATLTVASPDGARTAAVTVLSGERVTFTDDACRPPVWPPVPVGAVAGCVCDDAVGAWVEGANVFITGPGGELYVTGTDAEGCFVLENVAPGTHLLEIVKGAFYASHTVEVTADGTASIPSPATCAPPPPPVGSGSVAGRVCAPDGSTWLADATVYVERADGTRAQASTDAEGRYVLEGVPPGEQTVVITKGSFSTSVVVTVVEGQTSTIPESECALLPPDIRIAVVTGSYDRVEDVLADIGVDALVIDIFEGVDFFSSWDEDLLEDYATLSQYDIVFFNCGLNDVGFYLGLLDNPVAVDNLRQFVAGGGSVYASDWAYSIVERAWPDSIDFVGDDGEFGSAKRGDVVEALDGTIVDPVLAAQMPSSDIELHYPLIYWVPMADVASSVQVYIEADAPLDDGTLLQGVPHTVGFNAGQGRVIYTSFHQEPGISAAQERVLRLLMFEL